MLRGMAMWGRLLLSWGRRGGPHPQVDSAARWCRCYRAPRFGDGSPSAGGGGGDDDDRATACRAEFKSSPGSITRLMAACAITAGSTTRSEARYTSDMSTPSAKVDSRIGSAAVQLRPNTTQIVCTAAKASADSRTCATVPRPPWANDVMRMCRKNISSTSPDPTASGMARARNQETSGGHQ